MEEGKPGVGDTVAALEMTEMRLAGESLDCAVTGGSAEQVNALEVFAIPRMRGSCVGDRTAAQIEMRELL